MRHFTLLIFTLLLVTSSSRASFPPPEKTLAERLDLSTHVIVGTAKRVRVLTGKTDDKGNFDPVEVAPEPAILESGRQVAEIEIEVSEVLYPSQWKAPKTIRYVFGGGWFEVKSIRDDLLSKPHIYILHADKNSHFSNGEDLFMPSYGWHLFESLEAKPEIIALIQKRVEKEAAVNKPK